MLPVPEQKGSQMKKITGTVSILLAAVILIAASGCGAKAAPENVDVKAMAAEIIASGAYTDSMSDKTAAALSLYSIDKADVSEYDVYFSSMATAEECGVFKASGSEAASRVLAACKARQASQVTAYENYVPSEVSKINSAIIMQSGDYVLYIVSNDQSAVKTVLEKYGFTVK
jgi:hypothetical protein